MECGAEGCDGVRLYFDSSLVPFDEVKIADLGVVGDMVLGAMRVGMDDGVLAVGDVKDGIKDVVNGVEV